MNVWSTAVVVTSGLSLGLWGALAADDAKTDHAQMKKEHAKVHEEHDALLKKVGHWRVEHRKALAALREIEASILEHEAELEELAEHAREHEDHIRHHDEEIADHDHGGDGKGHAELAKTHKQLLEEHASVQKQVSTFHDDHDSLMASLTKLRDSLKKPK